MSIKGNSSKFKLILVFLGLFTLGISDLSSQDIDKPQPIIEPLNHKGGRIIFPDEYTILDDTLSHELSRNDEFLNAIEDSRQNYFRALILIQKGDTLAASHYFEQAMNKLNLLASYPGIDRNEEFTDLAQSIIEDYESFVKNIDYLDENSSMFIIRQFLYKEIENIELENYVDGELDDNIHFFTIKPGLMMPPDSLEIEMTDNKYVQISMKFLTERGSKFFKVWLERSSRWFPMMSRIAEAEGVPKEILYLSMIESGMNPNAVSRAKAVGLWQFMRSTGKLYGLNADDSPWVDERRDPEKATRAAMRHLRDLHTTFGDWHLAFAAYNCGAGCVSRAIRRARVDEPTFWNIRHKLPKETRKYVPRYISTALIAMNPEAYGFDLDSIQWEEEYKYDIYPLNEPINLDALAKACNITLEELRDLNPELIKNSTPPDVDTYYLKIPKGSADLFAQNLKLMDEDEKKPFLTHTVRRGETLSKIANQYGTTINELMSLNNLRRRSKLYIGQELEVSAPNVSSRDTKSKESSSSKTVTSPVNPVIANSKEDVTHTVKKGESLYTIARRYGVRISDIRNYNNIPYNKDDLNVGQKLIIAKKSPNTKSDVAKSATNKETHTVIHKVKKGETLGGIAELYSTRASSIRSLNGIRGSTIHPGQRLKIETTVKKNDTFTQTENFVHTVRRGDNLNKIANTYGISVDKLKQINGIATNKIYPGQKLKVQTTSIAEVPQSSSSNQTVVHKVNSGETLSTIAGLYGVTESHIKELNPDKVKGNTIYKGSRLKIKPGQTAKGSSSVDDDVNTAPVYYTIKRGDTLFSIANKFGVSINMLKSLNNNLSARSLQIGQKIRIK